MGWRLRTISDLSEARQQFVPIDGTQAGRPWVASLKCPANPRIAHSWRFYKVNVQDGDNEIFTILILSASVN
jgi:hypothetical protein